MTPNLEQHAGDCTFYAAMIKRCVHCGTKTDMPFHTCDRNAKHMNDPNQPKREPWEELKPCPFCGAAAECDSRQGFCGMGGHIDYQSAIYCTKCSANMTLCRGDSAELSDEERMRIITEAWNCRPDNATAELRRKVSELEQERKEFRCPHCGQPWQEGCPRHHNSYWMTALGTCMACERNNLRAELAALRADKQRIDWLERQEKLNMIRNDNICDYLVLAEDQTTCWGKTYREALDEAIRYSEAHPTIPPPTSG